MLALLALLLALALADPVAAGPLDAIGPTDIARVDDVIDAPHALFGRTRAEIERRLGPPLSIEERSVPRETTPQVRDRVEELAYPGLTLGVLAGSAALRRASLTTDAWPLPRDLGVGAPRSRVEKVLGEPQQLTPARYLYLYADGFPNTVEFLFRDDRVYRVEWNYSVE